MLRRSFLGTLSALPLIGLLKPKTEVVAVPEAKPVGVRATVTYDANRQHTLIAIVCGECYVAFHIEDRDYGRDCTELYLVPALISLNRALGKSCGNVRQQYADLRIHIGGPFGPTENIWELLGGKSCKI